MDIPPNGYLNLERSFEEAAFPHRVAAIDNLDDAKALCLRLHELMIKQQATYLALLKKEWNL